VHIAEVVHKKYAGSAIVGLGDEEVGRPVVVGALYVCEAAG
jgi:hypothetical protein